MKKLTAFLILVLSVSTGVCAKSGDIAGHYYSTDIKTFLNGAEIDSINIGGQTLISGEDMHSYGFAVWWNEGDRTLMIDETANAANGAPPLVVKSQLTPGTPVGYYYETDIVTYLDNEPITAYNIGGRTYIHAEEMRKFGYTVNWNEKERTLDIISPIRAGYVYDIGLSYGKKQTEEGTGSFSIKYTKDGLWGTDDADYLDLRMHSNGKGYTFSVVFYQNDGLFYSSALQNLLRPLCYDGYGVETPCEKSEKYDLVNKTVSISINGTKTEKVSVISGAGNGHRDFYFTVEDLPKLKKDEIEEIVFMAGNPTGEEYEIEIPDYVTNGTIRS